MADDPPVGAGVADRQRLRFRVAFFENDFASQLRLVEEELLELPPAPWQPAQTKGLLYKLSGQPELAAQQYAIARLALEPLVAAAPDRAGLHLTLGEALAGVGESAMAVHHAKRAMELVPPSSGVLRSQSARLQAIYVLTAAGATDEAVEELENYLSGPGAESIESLAVFPRLNALHDDPRFRELLQRFGRARPSLE